MAQQRIFPHNLAYFNELAGGPDGGYNWLVDSNLDWGQNLKELKTWLDAHGMEHVFLSQFSPSRPEVYGLQATLLPPSPRAAPFARFDPAPGWYAIGATTLQGAYTPDVDTFAYFRAMTPTARIGHALFVYHVPEQPRGEWVAQCASPVASAGCRRDQGGLWAQRFARGAIRLFHQLVVSCNRHAPGWYVASSPRRHRMCVKLVSIARAIYRPRNGQDSRLSTRVRRMRTQQRRQMQAREPRPPTGRLLKRCRKARAMVSAPVTTTGPLRFEGFWLHRPTDQTRPGGRSRCSPSGV